MNNNQTAAETENNAISKPDLGIYETRAWDAQYIKWANNQGQRPG